MKTYTAYITVTEYGAVTIEAENKDEALKRIQATLRSGEFDEVIWGEYDFKVSDIEEEN